MRERPQGPTKARPQLNLDAEEEVSPYTHSRLGGWGKSTRIIIQFMISEKLTNVKV